MAQLASMRMKRKQNNHIEKLEPVAWAMDICNQYWRNRDKSSLGP